MRISRENNFLHVDKYPDFHHDAKTVTVQYDDYIYNAISSESTYDEIFGERFPLEPENDVIIANKKRRLSK